MATTQPDGTGVGAEDLRQILYVLGQPEFAPPLAIPTPEYRERGLDEGFDPFEVFHAVQNHASPRPARTSSESCSRLSRGRSTPARTAP